LENRHAPWPSHQITLIRSPRRPRNTNKWPEYGSYSRTFSARAENRDRALRPDGHAQSQFGTKKKLFRKNTKNPNAFADSHSLVRQQTLRTLGLIRYADRSVRQLFHVITRAPRCGPSSL
jgi:hypothetical protein